MIMATSQRSKTLKVLRAALQRRTVENTTFQSLRQFTTKAAAESNADRATALIIGALLEQALEVAILTHFVGWRELTEEKRASERNVVFGYGADEMSPLHSFAARIRIGFALGIYGPKMNEDLETIKHIRNLFAHFAGPATFNVTQLEELCNGLNLVANIPRALVGEPKSARDKFIGVSQIIVLYLVSAEEAEGPLTRENSIWEGLSD
jgi:hypothetical protein